MTLFVSYRWARHPLTSGALTRDVVETVEVIPNVVLP